MLIKPVFLQELIASISGIIDHHYVCFQPLICQSTFRGHHQSHLNLLKALVLQDTLAEVLLLKVR